MSNQLILSIRQPWAWMILHAGKHKKETTMDAKKLSKAIRDLRNEVGDFQDERMVHDDSDYENINDTRGLLSVLANIVDGMPIDRAFGSPGDWGYETAIGAAIAGRG